MISVSGEFKILFYHLLDERLIFLRGISGERIVETELNEDAIRLSKKNIVFEPVQTSFRRVTGNSAVDNREIGVRVLFPDHFVQEIHVAFANHPALSE